MKKAMTILLTFIMVLQLIPIPAFATEEIATAEDLKAFLENPENVTVAEGSTLTVQISAENKFTICTHENPALWWSCFLTSKWSIFVPMPAPLG